MFDVSCRDETGVVVMASNGNRKILPVVTLMHRDVACIQAGGVYFSLLPSEFIYVQLEYHRH